MATQTAARVGLCLCGRAEPRLCDNLLNRDSCVLDKQQHHLRGVLAPLVASPGPDAQIFTVEVAAARRATRRLQKPPVSDAGHKVPEREGEACSSGWRPGPWGYARGVQPLAAGRRARGTAPVHLAARPREAKADSAGVLPRGGLAPLQAQSRTQLRETRRPAILVRRAASAGACSAACSASSAGARSACCASASCLSAGRSPSWAVGPREAQPSGTRPRRSC